MDKLGVQLPLLLAQVVNFGILIFILTKFLYRPIQKQLEARRQKIAAGLALTDSLQLKEEATAKKEAEVIKSAKVEAQKILAAGKKAGLIQKDHFIAEAKTEIARERVKLNQEMASELAQTKKALANQTIEIASSMAASIVADILDPAASHQLIAKSIAKLQKDHVRK